MEFLSWQANERSVSAYEYFLNINILKHKEPSYAYMSQFLV